MNCPKCGYECSSFDKACPACQAPLPTTGGSSKAKCYTKDSVLDSIFHSSGATLMLIAKIIYVIGIIITLISTVVGLWSALMDSSFLQFILAIVNCGLGFLFSYLSGVATYALGYIFDKVDYISTRL